MSRFTVIAIYPDNGQTYVQVYEANSAVHAKQKDERAADGRSRTILFVATGDLSQRLIIEPFAEGGALG